MQLIVAGLLLTIFPQATTAAAQATDRAAVHIVLDVSGSMNTESSPDSPKSRLDVAKEVLIDAVQDIAPGSVDLGLRTFSRCTSDLVVPVGPADPTAFVAQVDSIRAGGSTGIEAALRAAVADLDGTTGPRKIVLISDGVETCGGSPCSVAGELLASGIDFVVNTVGFQTSSAANAELQCIANVTGGTFSPADNPDDLFDAIRGPVTCTISLIECYAPEVRFHPAEEYFPMDPADFIEGSRLKWIHGADGITRNCWRDEEIDDDPQPALLGSGAYRAQQEEHNPSWSNWRRCTNYGKHYTSNKFTRPHDESPANGQRETDANGAPLEQGEGFVLEWTDYPDGSDVPSNLNNDPGPGGMVTAPMFAQLVTDPATGDRSIVYHMFYGFDPKSQVDPNDPRIVRIIQEYDGALAHEGDWERMIVELGPDDIPTKVRFEGHGCKGDDFEATNYVPWANMTETSVAPTQGNGTGHLVNGTHPVLYVAEGSHAAYPYLRAAGPKACSATLGLPSGNADNTEYDPATSRRWRPWEQGPLPDPQLECWYGFGGAWGRGGDFLLGRGHDSGPAGPHWNIPNLPVSSGCGNQSTASSDTRVVSWGDGVTIQVTGAIPGQEVVVSLASVERGVGLGVVDGAGTATVSFTLPEGFEPGGHHMIVRYVDTGDIVGVDQLNVEVPTSCLVANAGASIDGDLDGDNVSDACDSFPADGPYADLDGDGVVNGDDNCPRVANPGQAGGRDTVGFACDIDTGFNPASLLLAEAAANPVPENPPPLEFVDPGPAAPGSAPSAEPIEYEPFTQAPPEPTPLFGFELNPQVPESVPAVSVDGHDTAASSTAEAGFAATGDTSQEIAHTGAESRVGAMFGFLLVGSGAYAVARGRMRRRDEQLG